MARHVMFDIETLNTKPDSVVLSVGAVIFDPFTEDAPTDKIHWKLDVDSQLESGRTVSDGTMDFWSRQPQDVQDAAFSPVGRVQVKDFFDEFNRYVNGGAKIWTINEDPPSTAVWAQGPQFDIVILESLADSINCHCNWAFWQVKDSRTSLEQMEKDPRKGIQQQLHDAAEDAYWQAICVQKVHKHFGIKR